MKTIITICIILAVSMVMGCVGDNEEETTKDETVEVTEPPVIVEEEEVWIPYAPYSKEDMENATFHLRGFEYNSFYPDYGNLCIKKVSGNISKELCHKIIGHNWFLLVNINNTEISCWVTQPEYLKSYNSEGWASIEKRALEVIESSSSLYITGHYNGTWASNRDETDPQCLFFNYEMSMPDWSDEL